MDNNASRGTQETRKITPPPFLRLKPHYPYVVWNTVPEPCTLWTMTPEGARGVQAARHPMDRLWDGLSASAPTGSRV